MLKRCPRSASCHRKVLERDVAAILDERRDQTEMRVDARRPTVPPPPRGLAAGLPVSFSRAHRRTALAAETPKRSAACRRDMPAATAETTVLEDQAKGSSSTCMPASFASRQLESELKMILRIPTILIREETALAPLSDSSFGLHRRLPAPAKRDGSRPPACAASRRGTPPSTSCRRKRRSPAIRPADAQRPA